MLGCLSNLQLWFNSFQQNFTVKLSKASGCGLLNSTDANKEN